MKILIIEARDAEPCKFGTAPTRNDKRFGHAIDLFRYE